MPSKFLNLCEELSPENSSDPKWELIDFLKSKGVNVSVIQDTDMLYIDTGTKTIAVTISNNEEEAETINAGFGTYDIEKEVEGLGAKAASGLTGMAAKLYGTSAQQAKTALKERQAVAGQAIGAYKSATDRIKKGVDAAKRIQTKPKITR
jgi:hypothetical protein